MFFKYLSFFEKINLKKQKLNLVAVTYTNIVRNKELVNINVLYSKKKEL